MNLQDFINSFTVDQIPGSLLCHQQFSWMVVRRIEGSTDKLGDVFTYRYEDVHYSKQKITEFIPGKKVVWLVLESSLNSIRRLCLVGGF